MARTGVPSKASFRWFRLNLTHDKEEIASFSLNGFRTTTEIGGKRGLWHRTPASKSGIERD